MKKKLTILILILFSIITLFLFTTKFNLTDNLFKIKGSINNTEATFESSYNLRIKMKKLARNEELGIDGDAYITTFKRSSTKPSSLTNNNIVSQSTSSIPIYMWYDNGIIYWYSTANTVYLPSADDMFTSFSEITTIDMSGIDTSKVPSFNSMFEGCKKLKNLTISSFDTKNAEHMNFMFRNCSSLVTLNLSSFTSEKLYDFAEVFSGCTSLKTIYVSDGFNISQVIDNINNQFHPDFDFSEKMFLNCTSLVGGNGTKYNSNYINAKYARIDSSSTPGYFTKVNTRIRMDLPTENQNVNSTSIEIKGWVMSMLSKKNIDIYIDDIKISGVTYQERSDVIQNITNAGTLVENPTPGYYVKANIASLKTGTHTIKVKVVNNNTNTVIEEMSRTFKFTKPSVNIQYDINGGMLATDHGSTIGISNNLITENGSTNIEKIEYGTSLPDTGLSNYNNSSRINIKKTGYSAVAHAEWIDSNGKTYDQDIAYKASDFCDLTNGDCIKTLKVNWTKNKLQIKYHVNGGTLAPTHGSEISVSDSIITNNGNQIFETIYYGDALPNRGLSNYNNPTSINLVRSGYHVEKGKEWKNDQGKVFAQDPENGTYTISDFADITNESKTVILYVNWIKDENQPSTNTLPEKDGIKYFNSGSKLSTITNILGTTSNVKIFSKGVEKTSNDKIFTGDILKINNDEYEVAILGDPNCDGEVDGADISRTYKIYRKILTSSTNAEKIAADANEDDSIDGADISRIYKIYRGLYNSSN